MEPIREIELPGKLMNSLGRYQYYKDAMLDVLYTCNMRLELEQSRPKDFNYEIIRAVKKSIEWALGITNTPPLMVQ